MFSKDFRSNPTVLPLSSAYPSSGPTLARHDKPGLVATYQGSYGNKSGTVHNFTTSLTQ